MQEHFSPSQFLIIFLKASKFSQHFKWPGNEFHAIALLRVISEKAIDHCKDVFVAFVDYEKAFDRVHWPKLIEVLAKLGVDYRDKNNDLEPLHKSNSVGYD